MSTASHWPQSHEGLGAYHPNPWRQLSPAEFNALMRDLPCSQAMQHATVTHNNGATQLYFSCHGYSFLRQEQGAMNYWYVYNHPGQVVFNMKQYERPAVPARGGIPIPYAALRGVPHWPGVGHPDEGLAQTAALPNPQNRAEINAAIDVLAYFDTNGCSKTSLPVVVAFQNAYNASGLPGQLTIDGEYGPNSQRALQNVMDEAQADAGAGPSQQAPANCFPEYGNVPSIPALDRPNATPATPGGSTTLPTTVVTGNAPTSNAAILLIGGSAAAVAGGLGWWYYKRHKRGR